MREITKRELKVILGKHEDWLNNKEGGERADLRGTILTGADFRGANLSKAQFCGSDLMRADFSGANLTDADFRCANLIGANFNGAKLSGANFRYANVSCAKFTNADINDIIVDETTAFFHLQCPEKGSFTAFKKCEVLYKDVIVELLIPKSAKRSSATTRKCRCDKAKVVAFYDLEGNKLNDLKSARSIYDYNFVYELGKTVKVNNFNENRWSTCAEGIHFFMSFKEAVDYQP